MNDEKQVLNKWETDGNLAVIYQVENILLFYTKNNDPLFKKGQMINEKQADLSKPYKTTRYSPSSIPSDAYISLTFSWSK
ncbi:hypothetical protein KK120_08925 [Virgibacillus dakarensis]|nr:hypothetical protein [Virgibacillus dakarensis]MBT2215945.1 hypothetical protein [Virgibacillus dakarensis]